MILESVIVVSALLSGTCSSFGESAYCAYCAYGNSAALGMRDRMNVYIDTARMNPANKSFFIEKNAIFVGCLLPNSNDMSETLDVVSLFGVGLPCCLRLSFDKF